MAFAVVFMLGGLMGSLTAGSVRNVGGGFGSRSRPWSRDPSRPSPQHRRPRPSPQQRRLRPPPP
jgi:hypothetical protein